MSGFLKSSSNFRCTFFYGISLCDIYCPFSILIGIICEYLRSHLTWCIKGLSSYFDKSVCVSKNLLVYIELYLMYIVHPMLDFLYPSSGRFQSCWTFSKFLWHSECAYANRSPSPEPIYNNEGKRMNTREYRTRKKLEEDRHRAILRMNEINTDYKPPTDYKLVCVVKSSWMMM